MEKRPKVGLGVMVTKGDKVLMHRRQGAHGEGTWAPPGGHMEAKETFEECARRETREEAGIEIKNVKFVTVTNDLFDHQHYITIWMQAEYLSGEARIMEPEKCDALDWFSWEELPQNLFLSTKGLVEKGFDPFQKPLKRPNVGLGVFILKDGKFLLGKRQGAHGEGYWGLVGGHLEFNEPWEECAKREAMEEVGIKIKNVRYAALTNDLFDEEKKHYVTIFLVADYDVGNLTNREPEKCLEWDWFSWEELPHPLFIPIQNLLKQGFHINQVLEQKNHKNIFQHYNGNFYELVSEAKHSESLQDMVVYKALYNSPEFGNAKIWVRPKEMFYGEVDINGEKKRRFTRVRTNNINDIN